MNERKYRLIISDFDGTFFRSDHTIATENVDAVRKFVASGGIFVLSTGRPLQSIRPIAQSIGLKGLIAAFNGSVVADIESGELLLKNTFSPDEVVEICEVLQECGLYTQIYEIDRYYASERNDHLAYYEKVTGQKAVVSEIPMSEFARKNSIASLKILTIIKPEERAYYFEKLQEKLGDKWYLTSGGRNLIEICVKGFSKGTAVEFLANRYGVAIEDTLAVGDSLNDLPMLKTAGKGIAVKNAEDALKNEVFVYGYTNDENAVARIIEEYGYTGDK